MEAIFHNSVKYIELLELPNSYKYDSSTVQYVVHITVHYNYNYYIMYEICQFICEVSKSSTPSMSNIHVVVALSPEHSNFPTRCTCITLKVQDNGSTYNNSWLTKSSLYSPEDNSSYAMSTWITSRWSKISWLNSRAYKWFTNRLLQTNVHVYITMNNACSDLVMSTYVFWWPIVVLIPCFNLNQELGQEGTLETDRDTFIM